MNEQEFLQLSEDLKQLSMIIPLNWGNIQNDLSDSQINMFQIHSFAELERKVKDLKENSKNYFRRRWFLWKCAQCDEHIFCKNENVISNPNPRDQSYDIEFNGNTDLRFDVKGTVVPKQFRNIINTIIEDPSEMIKFFYKEQSRGVRNNIQNRLFIVHHSYITPSREMNLRCQWEYKIDIYKSYSSLINIHSNFQLYNGVKADIIFIFENSDSALTHKFISI